MRIIFTLILLAICGFALWVRHAPTQPARWHTDPADAPTGRMGGFTLRPGGDAEGPVLSLDAQSLLTRLDAIARATPRTRLIAGSVEEGRLTYETRSKFWGFPDYTTIAAAKVPGGVTPLINARLRFGKGDMGVNRARVQDWLSKLDAEAGIAE